MKINVLMLYILYYYCVNPINHRSIIPLNEGCLITRNDPVPNILLHAIASAGSKQFLVFLMAC